MWQIKKQIIIWTKVEEMLIKKKVHDGLFLGDVQKLAGSPYPTSAYPSGEDVLSPPPTLSPQWSCNFVRFINEKQRRW